jgi:alpha-tubulin suppressor-like RCC1 family protein
LTPRGSPHPHPVNLATAALDTLDLFIYQDPTFWPDKFHLKGTNMQFNKKSLIMSLVAAVGAAGCGGPVEEEGAVVQGQAQELTVPTHSLIGAGYSHRFAFSTALTATDPNLYTWGANEAGQLGDGTTTAYPAGQLLRVTIGSGNPLFNTPPPRLLGAEGGLRHSLASIGSGIFAWGDNSFGQLGDGTTTQRLQEIYVRLPHSALAAGLNHSLAVGTGAVVYAWGDNSSGQLGDGTTTRRLTPVQVANLTEVKDVAGGNNFSLALKTDGTVWAWGNNSSGQLGDGTTTRRLTPVQVRGLTGVVAIAAGDAGFALALKSDGTVWGWGHNANSQLGDGTTTRRLTPVQVRGLSGITHIAAGCQHALARKSDATLWGWGSNAQGQLGSEVPAANPTAVPVLPVEQPMHIATGCYYSFVAHMITTPFGRFGTSSAFGQVIPL